jgi:YbgC/YbaW family acyl-CoA thioester hydrolase
MDSSTASPASITLRRRIEWADTDAAGIYHWSTALRLAEVAEAALHTALGFADRTFGVTPRLHISCDFSAPLRFNDLVEVQLVVTDVGRTSQTHEVTVRHDGRVAATAKVVICHVDAETGQPTPWPDDIRELLASAGPQREVDGAGP